jgi:hypothetical protein
MDVTDLYIYFFVQYFSQFAASNLGSIGNIGPRTSASFPTRSISQKFTFTKGKNRSWLKTLIPQDI